MKEAIERFFVTGGTVPLSAASYLERAADQELLDALRAGEYCFVLNARQMGKSSLRVQTIARLREAGVVSVAIDLSSIGSERVSDQQWYAGIARALVTGLGLQRQVRPPEEAGALEGSTDQAFEEGGEESGNGHGDQAADGVEIHGPAEGGQRHGAGGASQGADGRNGAVGTGWHRPPGGHQPRPASPELPDLALQGVGGRRRKGPGKGQ